jgi:hypothetical protein
MARDYIEALRRHAAELSTLQGDQADEFLRLLRGLQTAIRGRIEAIANTGNDLTVFRLNAIIGETEAGIRLLSSRAVGQYEKGAQEAVDLSIDHIGDELDRLSLAFDAKPMEVTIDAAKVLADPAQKLLANHFESSVSRYGLDLLNGVRQRLFIALRTGDSMGSVVKDIGGNQGPFGAVGKSNAERLVRTEVSQAYGAAQHGGLAQAAKQVPALKKVWLHIGSYLCSTCAPLHGTERPLNGTWTIRQGFKEKKVVHAPAHPNCTCRISGMKATWREKLVGMGYLGDQPNTDEPGAARL